MTYLAIATFSLIAASLAMLGVVFAPLVLAAFLLALTGALTAGGRAPARAERDGLSVSASQTNRKESP